MGREGVDGAEERLERLAAAHAPDEVGVELHERRAQLGDVAHRGEARARIIDGEAHAAFEVGRDRLPEGHVVADRLLLGDLDDERRRVDQGQGVGDRAMGEVARADVQGEERLVGQARLGRHGEDALDGQGLELGPEADPLRLGEPAIGRPDRLRGETAERLVAHHRAADEGEDRLEDALEQVGRGKDALDPPATFDLHADAALPWRTLACTFTRTSRSRRSQTSKCCLSSQYIRTARRQRERADAAPAQPKSPLTSGSQADNASRVRSYARRRLPLSASISDQAPSTSRIRPREPEARARSAA